MLVAGLIVLKRDMVWNNGRRPLSLSSLERRSRAEALLFDIKAVIPLSVYFRRAGEIINANEVRRNRKEV
jgi:hypothetical protein